MKLRFFIPLLFLTMFPAAPTRAAGPEVTVVTRPNPEGLDRFAADELKRILETLFQAQVTLSAENLASPHRIRLEARPSDKPGTHFLQSTPQGLVLAGETPLDRLWAVYEFGHRNGIRSLPTGDFLPLETPDFSLDGYEETLTPLAAQRIWRTLGASPASQAVWDLPDFETLFAQLVKMKFNRVELVILPSQVFAGKVVPAPGSGIWPGAPLEVSGDLAGRSVFGGRKTFDHPALREITDPEERREAALAFIQKVIAAAKRVGLEVGIEVTGADKVTLAQVAELYPDADTVQAGPTGSIRAYAPARPNLLPPAGRNESEAQAAAFSVAFPLAADHAHVIWQIARGAFAGTSGPDHDLSHLILSICGEGVIEPFRHGLDALSEADALIAKEDPALGDPPFGDSAAAGFMRFYESSAPVPAWIAGAKELYGKAVGEFYRANTRARDGARPLLLRQAKRATFALHYLTAAEAARNAGIAKAAGEDEARLEQLESAIEAMHNALAIYAEVATERGDAGAIALLNDDGYRPLLRALDE